MSSYVFLFQLPALPERILARRDYRGLKRLVGGWGLDPDQLADSLKGVQQPGALTAILNYYRMLTRSYLFIRLPSNRLPMPTLILWGKDDIVLQPDLVVPSAAMCENASIYWLEDSGHFFQHEKPAEVSRALIDHFSA